MSAPKCHTHDCQLTPTHKVYWPGRDACLMCLPCAMRAKGIAEAMSFYLAIEKMTTEEVAGVT